MAFDKPLKIGILTLIHFFNNMAYKEVVMTIILYIKATVVSVCVGSAWKIFPVTTCSLWSW
jgi:hypothetical protein